AQPLVLSLGASFCGGHVVVPSPSVDAVLQPEGGFEEREAAGLAPDRHIFVYWFGSGDKTWRREVLDQIAAYRAAPGARDVSVHEIGSDYEARDVWQTDATSPALVLEEMFRSVFCPVVQGDVPHQKRLFDAMLTGCIPVVIAARAVPSVQRPQGGAGCERRCGGAPAPARHPCASKGR
ncbi:unnamed protein product, partial [Prorocentrum cordatum]